MFIIFNFLLGTSYEVLLIECFLLKIAKINFALKVCTKYSTFNILSMGFY